ncbi:MAG: pyruvate formate lyase family protein [Armatimonadia bacterium]
MASIADPDLIARLDGLRDRIFAGDNTHCFVERQRVLDELAPVLDTLPAERRYATILERLLDAASTPIAPEDLILGRMVEGPLPSGSTYLPSLPGFGSRGHLTPDWPALLSRGLTAIAADAQATAERLGDDEALAFAENAARCCTAVSDYAARYASAALAEARTAAPARREELTRAARALQAAPAGPAPDFFAALQGIWLVHLVLSCYVGARDFALGRLDQILLPLYQQGLADGTLTPDLARTYLAHFLMKTKEITGTTTDNYRSKPTPSFASNQYVVLGGRSPAGDDETNELTLLILEAASLVKMPQPELNVRLSRSSSPQLKQAVAQALPACHAQLQFWNDDLIIPQLERLGFSPDDAYGYSLTACNRINLPGLFDFAGGDAFHNMAHWLLMALDEGRDPVTGGQAVAGLASVAAMRSLDDVLAAFAQVAASLLTASVAQTTGAMRGAPHDFHFESVLLGDCVARGRDLGRGGLRYCTQYHYLGGVATVTNSLLAIQKLVFEQQRFGLSEFLAIVANRFAGHEPLRQEIVNALPKYGNDQIEADELARRVCEIALDALAAAPNPGSCLLFPAIYSLHCHLGWGDQLPATPDGRLTGEPISENQSPVLGTDRAGITALLRSVARLPLGRTPTGGLNLKLAFRPEPEMALRLVESYFALGGIHVGFTFVDRATLSAAQANPAQFRSLCVRVTGFSEFFVALSPAAQAEMIARTEY